MKNPHPPLYSSDRDSVFAYDEDSDNYYDINLEMDVYEWDGTKKEFEQFMENR